jgi:hypothetical protein
MKLNRLFLTFAVLLVPTLASATQFDPSIEVEHEVTGGAVLNGGTGSDAAVGGKGSYQLKMGDKEGGARVGAYLGGVGGKVVGGYDVKLEESDKKVGFTVGSQGDVKTQLSNMNVWQLGIRSNALGNKNALRALAVPLGMTTDLVHQNEFFKIGAQGQIEADVCKALSVAGDLDLGILLGGGSTNKNSPREQVGAGSYAGIGAKATVKLGENVGIRIEGNTARMNYKTIATGAGDLVTSDTIQRRTTTSHNAGLSVVGAF